MFLNKNRKFKRILLTGGGTGGSVTPLLAIAEELKKTPFIKGGEGDFKFLWLGTRSGPERIMVEAEGIKFVPVFGGKIRRYFSFKNLADPFFVIFGFFESLAILLVWRPSLVVSAGGFISVPIAWAAWILRMPVLIHQQDVRPGLANKLMAPFARAITVTFEKSLTDYGKKAVWTGNPARRSLEIKNQKSKIKNIFGFDENSPVVLIMGGGTGAQAINELVEKSVNDLIKFCQVIHVTGFGKSQQPAASSQRYKNFQFLNAEQIAAAYQSSDVVVSRAGMGSLTELSYLGKPTILIPIPNSHQEENAEIFHQAEAVVVLSQKELTPDTFVANIRKLLETEELRNQLSNNIQKAMKRGANGAIIELIKNLIK